MRNRTFALIVAVALLPILGFAKDKSKTILPSYVLNARTVAVVIDPDAGISVEDPLANQVARKDVEAALQNWGRFDLALSPQAADLIVVVRRGHGRMVNETISDPRQNSRMGDINQTQNAASMGAQHGPQPPLSGTPDAGSAGNGPRPQMEIGSADDTFAVYQGGVTNPLDSNPGWRYTGRDGLRPHNVPAVEEFKKAITAAEKAAAKKP